MPHAIELHDLTEAEGEAALGPLSTTRCSNSFAGSDYEIAVVPPAARALLRRFDPRSAHYQVRERRLPTEA